MTGNLHVIPDHRLLVTSARAAWELSDGRGIVFEDPRALGRLSTLALDALPEVGWDPLDAGFTAKVLAGLARGSRRAMKSV